MDHSCRHCGRTVSSQKVYCSTKCRLEAHNAERRYQAFCKAVGLLRSRRRTLKTHEGRQPPS